MPEKVAAKNDVGRDLSFGVLMHQCWQEEIQEAVHKVGNRQHGSDSDKWVKWYKSLEKGRKMGAENIRRVFRVR
jgi:hypothetical protein